MTHIILALGLVIGGYIHSIVFQLTPKAGMQVHELYLLKQYASIGYIVGLLLAFVLVKAISLKPRLPAKIPGHLLLIIGVWLYMITLIYKTFIQVKLAAGYFIGSLHFHDALGEFIQSLYLHYIPFSTIASALIIYTLLLIFLESRPREVKENV
jgi:hypothetical protein